MKSNSKWNWLMVLTAVAIFSFFSTGNVQAWGPLAQSAIAQAVQDADGVPPAIANHEFVLETTLPKVFEYTDQSYAKNSYDYTEIMLNNLHGMTGYCQALAWGASQSAEKTGDRLFFDNISGGSYERWISELMSDALLFCIESPYHGSAVAEVAVMPKLVSDTSVEYTDIFGGAPFSGFEAIEAAHFQAHVLVGELAIIDSQIFRDNAKRHLNQGNWVIAMDQSVADAVEYVINSTQAASGSNWMPGDIGDYGTQILGKLGSILVATGNAAIGPQDHLGIYSYRVGLSSDQVNEITLAYLGAMSRNLNEHPIMRYLAMNLHHYMTEEVIDATFAKIPG